VNNLNDATEKICELKGSVVALDALLTALLHELPPVQREGLLRRFLGHTEVARTVMLHATISEHTLSTFERDVGRFTSMISAEPPLLVNTASAEGSDHTDQG
jgi:hypothetical protein